LVAIGTAVYVHRPTGLPFTQFTLFHGVLDQLPPLFDF
jgi:hypothetical protein